MDLRQLSVLVAVAETGSFSAAARIFRVSAETPRLCASSDGSTSVARSGSNDASSHP